MHSGSFPQDGGSDALARSAAAAALWLLGWTSVTLILLDRRSPSQKIFRSSGIQLFPQVQLQLEEMRQKLSLMQSHVDETKHPGETVLSCCPAECGTGHKKDFMKK